MHVTSTAIHAVGRFLGLVALQCESSNATSHKGHHGYSRSESAGVTAQPACTVPT